MTTPNPEPLQKQLFDIDLSKGVNERDRPETAQAASALSRVENLFQDQAGGYVKRYGTPLLGGVAVDDTGAALTNPTKLLRLKGGLGLIGNSGKFYQYMENNQRFTNKDQVPDLNVSGADMVVSSGPAAFPKIHSVASTAKYHAMVYESGVGVSTDSGWRVVIYERESNAVVFRATVPGLTAAKIAFVDDRYLHLYYVSSGLNLTVYDTSANPIVGTTPTVVVSGATLSALVDTESAAGRSFVLYTKTTPNSNIAAYDNTGTLLNTSTTTTTPAVALSVFGTSVWYATATQAAARSTTNVATVVLAEAAFAGGANFVATTTNTIAGLYSAVASTPAFGGSTIGAVGIGSGALASGLGTLYGWNIASKPFVDSTSGNVYIHLTKASGLTTVSHVIAKLTYRSINAVTAQSYTSFRLAAGLEPHLAVANSDILKYKQLSSGEFCPALPIQTVARGYSYCVFSAKPFFHAGCTTQVFGGQSYISGGAHTVLAADRIQECGFADMPVINGAISATAGPTGSFKHIAVYRFVDESGAVTWSRTSVLASTTTAAKGIDITVSAPHITMRDIVTTGNPLPQLQSVEVYRTKTGGTVYYLCGSSQIGTPSTGLLTQLISLGAASYYTFTDTMTDTNLALQPTLFRQPGTTNAAVDRYPPPCGNILCQHKDRLFTSDPYGARVYYSSFFVDGETAWYNPVFSFFVHGGSGPITGMVSMDGRLFVFKRDGIFVIDGDGPAEGGVAGNEFSPPQRLATEYGCIDQRSMVVTTDGIVYRSARGIEILTRSLQVKWLGERVQVTVNANAKCTGAVLDTFGRVHIGLAASDTLAATQANTNGCEVVYDSTTDSWTVSYHTDSGGSVNRCFQDMCQADLYGIGETVCYADPSGCVCYSSSATGLDRGSRYVPWTIETVWVKTGQQARAKFSKALLLAKKRSGANHKITISAAYNYVDSYSQVGVFEPLTINAATIEELQQNLNRPEATSIRLLFQESAPTDTVTYPIGTGLGCDVLGISVEIAPKFGAPMLASGQKV